MPNSCCVPGCNSNYGHVYTNSFGFPSDPELKEKWTKLIPRSNFTPTKNSIVCAKHFLDEHIINCEKLKRKDGSTLVVPRTKWTLRPNAVPMIFPESAFTVSSCIIYQCKSACNTDEVKLYGFPKDQKLAKKWIKIIKALNGQDIVVHQTTRICSEHFEEKYKKSNFALESNAIPSIFQNQHHPNANALCDNDDDDDSDVLEADYDPLAISENMVKKVTPRLKSSAIRSKSTVKSPTTPKNTPQTINKQLPSSNTKKSIKPQENSPDVVIVKKNSCIYPKCKHDNLSGCQMICAPTNAKEQMIWRRLLKHPDTLKYRTIDKVCSCHFIVGSPEFGPVLVGNINNHGPLEYAKQSVMQLKELVKQTKTEFVLEPCSVKNCTSKANAPHISFYAPPMVAKHMSSSFMSIKKKCRDAWLSVIPLKIPDIEADKIIVCSKHFRYGKPADVLNYCHIDWVPTLKLNLPNDEDPNETNNVFNEWSSYKRNMGEWIFGSSKNAVAKPLKRGYLPDKPITSSSESLTSSTPTTSRVFRSMVTQNDKQQKLPSSIEFDPKMNSTVKVVLENINPQIEKSHHLQSSQKKRQPSSSTLNTSDDSITARDIIKDLLGEDYLKDIENIKYKRQKAMNKSGGGGADAVLSTSVTNTPTTSAISSKPKPSTSSNISPMSLRTPKTASALTSATSVASTSSSHKTSSNQLKRKFNYIDNNLLGKSGKMISRDLLSVDDHKNNVEKEFYIKKSKIDSAHIFIDDYSDDDVDEQIGGDSFADNSNNNNDAYLKAIAMRKQKNKNKELLNRAYNLVYKSKSDKPIKPIKCELCKKIFSTLILYHNHFTANPQCHQDGKNNNYQCSVCDKLFTNFNNFVNHFDDHCQIRSYFCNECRRHGVCTTLAQLEHMRQHFPNEKLYICDLCDRVCHELNDLTKHVDDVHYNIAAIVPKSAVIRPSDIPPPSQPATTLTPTITTTNTNFVKKEEPTLKQEDYLENENILYDVGNGEINEFDDELDQREYNDDHHQEEEENEEEEVAEEEEEVEEIIEETKIMDKSMPIMSIQIDIDGQINYIPNEQTNIELNNEQQTIEEYSHNLDEDDLIEYNPEQIIPIDSMDNNNMMNLSTQQHIIMSPTAQQPPPRATVVSTPRSTVINCTPLKLGVKKNVSWGNNSTIEISDSNNSESFINNSPAPTIVYKCEPCNDMFESAQEFQKHKILKHKTKYRCKICSIVVTDLENHRKTHNICSICSTPFNSQEELNCHTIIAH